MKKLIVLFVFVFLVSFIFSADQVDVTGKWDMTVSTPRGERNTTIEFKQDGEDLKVTLRGRQGTVTADGKVIGDSIEWTVERNTPRGAIRMDYTGKVSGDSMNGKVQFGQMGSGDWRAKRQQ